MAQKNNMESSAVNAMLSHRYGAWSPVWSPDMDTHMGEDPRSVDRRLNDMRTADQRARPAPQQVRITRIEPQRVQITKIEPLPARVTRPSPDPEPQSPQQARRWTEVKRANDEFAQLLAQADIQSDMRRHWSFSRTKDSQGNIIKQFTAPAYAFAFAVPLESALQQLGAHAMGIAARHGTSVTALTIYPEGGSAPMAMIAFSDDPSIVHRVYKTPFYT